MTTALTVTLDDDLMARIQAAAAEAGLSSEAWAARVLTETFTPVAVREDAATFDTERRTDDLLAQMTPQARAFEHAASLAALEEYDRTGLSYPLEDVLAELRADLETRLAAKA